MQNSQQQRIDDCFELYKKHGGCRHDVIEREMRSRGHDRFCRRILYRRFERGKAYPGWIDRFGWRAKLDRGPEPTGFRRRGRRRRGIAYANRRSEPPALAGGSDFRGEPASESQAPIYRTSGPPAYAGGSDLRSRLAKIKVNRQKARRLRKLSAAGRLAQPQGQHQHTADTAQATSFNAHLQPPATAGGSDDFHAWLKTLPGIWKWDWRHQIYLYERLKKVTDGTCKRLMIFMPPRHGKSELVTVRYSAWRILRDPSMNIILGSYNQQLANRFSRKIRRVICDDSSLTAETQRHEENSNRMDRINRMKTSRQRRRAHPEHPVHPVEIPPPHQRDAVGSSVPMFPFIKQRPANSVAEWETAVGGGLRAVGVGGGVTGFGAQLIVIDDPVKSRAQAESLTFRNKVWDWFNDDLYTRLEPNGSIILIQTRWHEDDLAGRLLREAEEEEGEKWEVIDLPALAEESLTAETQRRRDAEKMRTASK